METQSQMSRHYQSWINSGLTQKQYAQKHKINYKTFNSWSNKLKIQDTLLADSSESQPQISPSFIEISSDSNATSQATNNKTAQIELELPSGLRIKIY